MEFGSKVDHGHFNSTCIAVAEEDDAVTLDPADAVEE
jgi:hypothetical protein